MYQPLLLASEESSNATNALPDTAYKHNNFMLAPNFHIDRPDINEVYYVEPILRQRYASPK